MRIRILAIACLAAAAPAGAAPTGTTLSVSATFTGAEPTVQRGTIRLTVRGVGDTNSCGDHRPFLAEFTGPLELEYGTTYVARLHPVQQGVRTAEGCRVAAMAVEQITDAELDAQLGDLHGVGTLAVEALAAAGGRELAAGNLGDLYGDIQFQPTNR